MTLLFQKRQEKFPSICLENQDDHTYDYYYEMPETESSQPQNGTNHEPETLSTPWGRLETYYVGGHEYVGEHEL